MGILTALANVRYWEKADIAQVKRHVNRGSTEEIRHGVLNERKAGLIPHQMICLRQQRLVTASIRCEPLFSLNVSNADQQIALYEENAGHLRGKAAKHSAGKVGCGNPTQRGVWMYRIPGHK